jgi:hypothetical protein
VLKAVLRDGDEVYVAVTTRPRWDAEAPGCFAWTAWQDLAYHRSDAARARQAARAAQYAREARRDSAVAKLRNNAISLGTAALAQRIVSAAVTLPRLSGGEDPRPAPGVAHRHVGARPHGVL